VWNTKKIAHDHSEQKARTADILCNAKWQCASTHTTASTWALLEHFNWELTTLLTVLILLQVTIICLHTWRTGWDHNTSTTELMEGVKMWLSSLLWYLLTYVAEPFSRSRQLCSHSRTSQHFKEPEGSIRCFTRALHWSLSWAISIQSTPSHPI
jgi:hypothetical protein